MSQRLRAILDPAAIVGNVGIVSQSGSVCIALLSDLRRYGVSLSVSAGNEAVTRTVDYIDYLVDDPNTKVIATFTETVREPERYVAALDLSGHGDSGRRETYSLDLWAAEVLGVAEDAGIAGPPTVIGHSMGGFVTLRAASLTSTQECA